MNIRELLQAFYALYIYYKTETPSKELFGALKSPALLDFDTKIPALQPTLLSAFQGDMDYASLGKDLRAFIAAYAKDPRSKTSTVDLLKAFASWFLSSSEAAAAKIERYSASKLFDRWIPSALTQTLSSQVGSQAELRKVMKKLTGTPSLGFSDIEEAKAAKLRDPEAYAEYLRLRREFNSIWKVALSNFVRDSGNHLVEFTNLLKYFKANGIEHGMPLGFTGKIDANGNWYSSFGEELVGVPSAAVFPTVKMNPAYTEGSSEYVFQAMKAGDAPGNYFYTKNAARKSARQKFSHVQDFLPIVNKVRAKWVTAIKAFDPDDRRTVAAVILELLFQFSARIGTVGNSTFGLGTLLVKHYSALPSGDGFQLKYLGKDGVPTKHVYRGTDPLSKMIIKIMANLVEGKSPKDPIFTYNQKNGLFRIVQPAVVNGLFQALGASNLTVHKLRTYHATRIFREQVAKIYAKHAKFKDTKEALEVLKKAAMFVGKALNHVRRSADGSTSITPATALSAYINIGDQVKFFQDYGLPLPKYLENFATDDSVTASNIDDMPPEFYMRGSEEDEGEADALTRDEGSNAKDAPTAPKLPYDENDPAKEAQQVEEFNERQKKEEAEDEKLREQLEEQAVRVAGPLLTGGEGSSSYSGGEIARFQNVLLGDNVA